MSGHRLPLLLVARSLQRCGAVQSVARTQGEAVGKFVPELQNGSHRLHHKKMPQALWVDDGVAAVAVASGQHRHRHHHRKEPVNSSQNAAEASPSQAVGGTIAVAPETLQAVALAAEPQDGVGSDVGTVAVLACATLLVGVLLGVCVALLWMRWSNRRTLQGLRGQGAAAPAKPQKVRSAPGRTSSSLAEFKMVRKGRRLSKVLAKDKTVEDRFVRVDLESCMLVWGNEGLRGAFLDTTKKLDLADVLHIDYGWTGRCRYVSGLFPDAHPWLCLSLTTADRSFDFVCPDEYTVQAYMLALSRLCGNASGCATSRGQICARAGWCKVLHGCAQKKIALPAALLKGVRKAQTSLKDRD
eukprot:TRINITY_DN35194_c0_g1_i1.p1 TRINITY_DN35194_c0_g1~~TRINITY_DN35194_c0_g1_i1.p1  ORF type:complete len:356 (-),score=56.26 TRINITY_DN35194_c0_g1_i1:26-1093(-)